jgi:ATP-dependent helicase HepA
MAPFAPGQRWLSNAEPELGLGTVLRVDGRQIQVLFAASGTLRQYAMLSAPLARAAFRVGERVRVGGRRLMIEQVESREGVLHYRTDDGEIAEGALDDQQDTSQADARLMTGRVDRCDRFDLRRMVLQRRAQAMASPAWGVLSARIGLIEHQLRIADIAAQRRPPRVLLADEVGLGKTIEAGLILSRLAASGRAVRMLVLVPEALVYQWFVELRRRFNLDFAIYDEERVESIALEGDGRNPFLDDQRVLTDLDFLLAHPARAASVLDAGWDVLVVDEAHHLAWSPESTSPAYALVEQLAARTPGAILLTATPEQLGRSGHFARLRLLDPARFHDLAAYQHEAEQFGALSGLTQRLLSGSSLDAGQLALLERLLAQEEGAVRLLASEDAQARQSLLRSLVDRHGTGRAMFRTRRATVGGFPRRIAHIVELEHGDDAALRERALEEFLADASEPPSAPPLNYLDDPRLQWLIALLERHTSEKFLLICRSQPKVHALEEALRVRSGVAVARFHEGLGIVQRDRNAAHFADPGGARVLLCTEIGSEGRNFQFAHHLVLWDLPLDPDLLEQRIGRLDRIGQTADVHIHTPVLAGSAQRALAHWYARGLNAFESSPQDGRALHQHFGTELRTVAAACARGEPDADERLTALINATRDLHAELAERIEQGRDRLLELTTRFAPEADRLREALEADDTDHSVDELVTELLESFGVDVDDLGERVVRLDPEMLSTEALVGLGDGPRQATFDRAMALAREELDLLRLDHPLVTGALDLLLGSETGNAAFVVDESQMPRTVVLEAVYVLECLAPPVLNVERFLPPAPLTVVVDSKLAIRADFAPHPRAVARCAERPVDPARQRKVLTALVPPMLAATTERAHVLAAEQAATALAQARSALGAEYERLSALARVNPGVRPQELEALRHELDELARVLPTARARLDAVRLTVSPDFLALRG